MASEIDLFCTLVAGSDDPAEALVADPRLEAWRVQPADPIAFDSDQIDTYASNLERQAQTVAISRSGVALTP